MNSMVRKRSSSSSSTMMKTIQNLFTTDTEQKIAALSNAFKICVLGAPQVGKTTLIEEAIYGTRYRLTHPYEPTIEDSYCAMVEYDKNLRERIFLYDYAGMTQPPNLDLIKMYLSFCDAFILVFAINDRSSFMLALQIKRAIEKQKDKKDIPIIMLANKMDRLNESQMDLEEVKRLAIQEKVKYMEVSANDRKTISECLIYLTSKIILLSKSSFSRKSKTGSLQLEL